MVKKRWMLLLSICMLTLTACGEEQAPEVLNHTEVNTEAVTETKAPTQIETQDATKVPSQTDAPVFTTEPIPTETSAPEIPVEAKNWPEVQAELEQQGLQYVGYYTITMERLDVMVEDGTEMIFLYNNDATSDETEMWIDYNEDRKPEEYTLVMKNDTFYRDIFEEYYLGGVTKDSTAYYQPDASMLWGEITPYTMGLTGLELSEKQLYAKHGLIFEDDFWNAVFQQKDWYEPKYTAAEFVEGEVYQLTDIEQENLQVLHRMQDDFNGRKAEGAKGLVPIATGSWWDLDGDGNKEQIWLDRHVEDEDFSTVTVTVQSENGIVSFQEAYPGVHSACYLSDMENGNDFIAIAMDGISADFWVELLQYENGQLTNLGQIGSAAVEIVIEDNKLIGNVESYHLQCQPVIREFEIQDNRVIEIEKDYYAYRGNTATVLKALEIYTERGETQATDLLEVGESVIILGGDMKEWVQIERVSTGEKYWIKVEWHDCYLPDGTIDYSGNVFNGLTFYG